MAGELSEIPMLMERLRRVGNAVKDHRDESERLAGVVAVAQRLSQQQASETMALMIDADAEPGQHGHGEVPTREMLCKIGGQIS